MAEFEPEFKGYYALIRSGAETAEALPGKVHDVLMVSNAARSDMLPVMQIEPQPDVPDGKVLVRCYRRTAEAIELRYRIDDAQSRPPRRWSRLTVKGALADARLLPAARTFLAAYEIKPDYPALEAFSDCDYIEEFYGGADKWNQLLDGAAQALGKTRAEVDAFLDSLPEETA